MIAITTPVKSLGKLCIKPFFASGDLCIYRNIEVWTLWMICVIPYSGKVTDDKLTCNKEWPKGWMVDLCYTVCNGIACTFIAIVSRYFHYTAHVISILARSSPVKSTKCRPAIWCSAAWKRCGLKCNTSLKLTTTSNLALLSFRKLPICSGANGLVARQLIQLTLKLLCYILGQVVCQQESRHLFYWQRSPPFSPLVLVQGGRLQRWLHSRTLSLLQVGVLPPFHRRDCTIQTGARVAQSGSQTKAFRNKIGQGLSHKWAWSCGTGSHVVDSRARAMYAVQWWWQFVCTCKYKITTLCIMHFNFETGWLYLHYWNHVPSVPWSVGS